MTAHAESACFIAIIRRGDPMTRSRRHLCRIVMRVSYTATGFFSLILSAIVAHDGVGPTGNLLPTQLRWIASAAACWALAVVLDGLSSEPGHR